MVPLTSQLHQETTKEIPSYQQGDSQGSLFSDPQVHSDQPHAAVPKSTSQKQSSNSVTKILHIPWLVQGHDIQPLLRVTTHLMTSQQQKTEAEDICSSPQLKKDIPKSMQHPHKALR